MLAKSSSRKPLGEGASASVERSRGHIAGTVQAAHGAEAGKSQIAVHLGHTPSAP